MELLTFYGSGLRDFMRFRCRPSMDLLVVLVSFLALIAGLYSAWKTFTIASAWVPVSMFILGVVVPIAYNSLVKKRPLSETGLSKKYWLRSLILGPILFVILFLFAPSHSPLASFIPAVASLTFTELLPLLALELTAGLFWTIFFHGWVQMRFERAFGAIPAILVAATFFALHHVGYGEPLSLSHLAQPFVGGIIFSTVFRLTRNILILWPIFHPVSGLFADLTTNLRLPFGSTYGYTGVLALMWLFIAIVYWKQKERRSLGALGQEPTQTLGAA